MEFFSKKFTSNNACVVLVAFCVALYPKLFAANNSFTKELEIVGISWIDAEGLPTVWDTDALTIGWPARVMIGLKGTQNPRPPENLPSDFRNKRHFRAMTSFKVNSKGEVSDSFLDAGYTPPIDKTKVPIITRTFFIPDDPKFYAGEKSALSSISVGKLHSSSSLKISNGHSVIASSLIKFRAGIHTNNIGISKEVGSPYHVPWVWSEHALVKKGEEFFLVASGSRFPSHAWYVNGKRVGILLQSKVGMSESEPAFVSGAPAGNIYGSADSDSAKGVITTQPYTVPERGRVVAVKVP